MISTGASWASSGAVVDCADCQCCRRYPNGGSISYLRVGRRTPLGACTTCIKDLTRSVADRYASQPGQASIFSILFRQSNRFIGCALPGTRTSNPLMKSVNFTHSGECYLELFLPWLHRRVTCSALVDWS
jgi:hypothetical protein